MDLNIPKACVSAMGHSLGCGEVVGEGAAHIAEKRFRILLVRLDDPPGRQPIP